MPGNRTSHRRLARLSVFARKIGTVLIAILLAGTPRSSLS
jgi:hypothetical protein